MVSSSSSCQTDDRGGLFSKLLVVLQNVRVPSKHVGRSWAVCSCRGWTNLNWMAEKRKRLVLNTEKKLETDPPCCDVREIRRVMLWHQRPCAILSTAATGSLMCKFNQLNKWIHHQKERVNSSNTVTFQKNGQRKRANYHTHKKNQFIDLEPLMKLSAFPVK